MGFSQGMPKRMGFSLWLVGTTQPFEGKGFDRVVIHCGAKALLWHLGIIERFGSTDQRALGSVLPWARLRISRVFALACGFVTACGRGGMWQVDIVGSVGRSKLDRPQLSVGQVRAKPDTHARKYEHTYVRTYVSICFFVQSS